MLIKKCIFANYINEGLSKLSMFKHIKLFFIIFFSVVVIASRGQEKKDSLILLITQLDSLADHNYKKGNDSLAIIYGEQSLEIKRILLGVNHQDYIKSLNNLATYYYDQGNYNKSNYLITEALTNHNVKDSIYAQCLFSYADICSIRGRWSNALMLCDEAVSIYKNLFGDDHIEYAKSLANLASIYYDQGNVRSSLQLCKKALNIYTKLHIRNTYDYACLLYLLAKGYSDIQENKKAISYGLEGISIINQIYGNKHPDYATGLSIVGVIYFYMESYDKAIVVDKEALSIYEHCYGKEHYIYALALNNLANDFFYKGYIENAIQMYEESLSIFRKILGEENSYCALLLSNISMCKSHFKDYDEAILYAEKAMNIRAKIYGTQHIDYVISLRLLAEYYFDKGYKQKALKLAKKAMKIERKNHRTGLSYYAALLEEISHYYLGCGNDTKAYLYAKKSVDLFIKYSQRNWGSMSKSLQEDYWTSISDRLFNFSGLGYRIKNHSISSDIYNYIALFAKGMLMSSETEIKNAIMESKDSILINNYMENISLYNNMMNLSRNNCYINSDSLIQSIILQENKIAKLSKPFEQLKRNQNITWEDILHNIDINDIAIEIIPVPLKNDSIIYLALSIRKDSKCPKLTILFEEKQLKQIPDTIYYQCKEMTDLVWKPLQAELEGVKNIYFSPSGALYNIGIEYLPEMENYNIHRLSSTRELVTRKDRKFKNRAVLYGGLDYYANLDTLNKSKSVTSLDETFVDHADVRGMGLRGGKEKLEHTKNEVEKIGEEFNRARWVCHIDSASLGTEESFKALSGRKVGCLHIATHGFYYTKKEADNTNYDFLHLNNYMASAEDKALTRSGLILSGANHILEGDTLPDNVEDGILTAKEIADVDLRGLDLVVLSACQTGLGDISQGEGVFGLQRGFKKAGANSILMSLWEVDDKATQLLMTQFYRNLLAGQSKRQSLLSAQKYLREVEGGIYNEPKYWAAFILLDGIK